MQKQTKAIADENAKQKAIADKQHPKNDPNK